MINQTVVNTLGSNKLKEGYVPISEGNLYFKSIGKGTPVILIHGGPGLSHNHFLPQMYPLAESHNLILYDQRGSGKSFKSSINDDFLTLEQFVSDLDNLRKYLNRKKIIILGHSWGSFLAIFYALTHPQHVESLILMGPQPMCYKGMKDFEDTFNKRFIALQDKLSYNIIEYSENMDSEALIQRYRALSAAFCFNTNKAKELTLYYDPEADQSGTLVQKNLSKKLFSNEWDYHNHLSKITAPTSIIHGAQDPIPLWVVEKIYQNLPDAKLAILDQCGHFPYIEQPKAFFKEVNDFLKIHP